MGINTTNGDISVSRLSPFLTRGSLFNILILIAGSVSIFCFNSSQMSKEIKFLISGASSAVIGSLAGVYSISHERFLRDTYEWLSQIAENPGSYEDFFSALVIIFSFLGVFIFFINWTGFFFAFRYRAKKNGEKFAVLRRLEGLSFPTHTVWVGILSLIALAFFALIPGDYTTWIVGIANVLIIFVLLYGLQGLGLVGSYLRYKELPEHRINGTIISLVVVSAFPIIGNFCFALLCILGIAKLWIRIPTRGI